MANRKKNEVIGREAMASRRDARERYCPEIGTVVVRFHRCASRQGGRPCLAEEARISRSAKEAAVRTFLGFFFEYLEGTHPVRVPFRVTRLSLRLPGAREARAHRARGAFLHERISI